MTLLEAAIAVVDSCDDCHEEDCIEHEDLREAIANEPVPGETGRGVLIAALHKAVEAGDLARRVLAEMGGKPI